MCKRVMALHVIPLAMIGLMLSGCPEGEGDTTTVINNYVAPSSSGARDTLDLNNGTDAGFSGEDGPALFSGPDGRILMCFQQPAENFRPSSVSTDELTGPYNFARVLGDTAGPIMAMDDHAHSEYEASYEFMAQSWNLRYVAFLNLYGDFRRALKLVVFDFQTGEFTPAAHLASTDTFGEWGQFQPFLDASALHVDNTGRATVIFQAVDAASNSGTDRALWTVQYDTSSRLITRAPTIISGPFATTNQFSNEAYHMDSRVAANGDIAVVIQKTQDFGSGSPDFRTVPYTTVYKAATDTWGAVVRTDGGVQDRFGSPVAFPPVMVLDTDGNSFHLAFIQVADSFSPIHGVFSSRFVAHTAAAFPSPVRLDTATAATPRRVESQVSQALDIHFGRNGACLVHWIETESPAAGPSVRSFWMSHSSDSVAPSSANSAELLNVTAAANGGYTIPGFSFFNPTAPRVAFDDAGNAVIAFTAQTASVAEVQELYLATFNGTTILPATVGAGNLASQHAPAAGQSRRLGPVALDGYSAGASPRCVLAWSSSLWSAADVLLASSSAGTVITGLTPGATVQLDSSSVRETDVEATSGNRFARSGRAQNGLIHRSIRTDDYPAFGNGNVWLVNVRQSNATGTISNGYPEVRIMSFNPAVHSNLAVNGSSLTSLGQIDRLENWVTQSDGSLDIACGVIGHCVQRSYTAAAAPTGDPTASALQVLTPPDMGISSSFTGVHMDGLMFTRTFTGAGVSSTLVNVPRRWSLWMASDGLNERIFGVRSR